jgi:hypothetical protein
MHLFYHLVMLQAITLYSSLAMFSGDWQPSTAVSEEESWSEIDPKRSKFAQWFHSEGMKRTRHGVVLYSHTCFICVCATHAYGLSR